MISSSFEKYKGQSNVTILKLFEFLKGIESLVTGLLYFMK